jgi:hypothetical protein
MAEKEEEDASADSDYERVHTLARSARAAAGVPDNTRAGDNRKRSGQQQQQQQQQRGSTGRKKQPARRRRARDESSEHDQDEDSSKQEQQDAAAAAADEEAQLAGQEGEEQEEEEEEEDEQEQYTAEQFEAMLAEDANEVVAVRSKGLAGHLKSIQVQNFMCHQNFAMDFG